MTSKNRFIMVMGTAVIILLFFLVDHLGLLRMRLDVDGIRNLIEGTGMAGILIFIAICMFRQIFFLPTLAVFIAGGLIFGALWGPVYALFGHMINISLAYYIGGRFEHLIEGFISERYVEKLRNAQGKGSWKKIFTMRTTPGFPIDAISFGAGFVQMDFRNYFIGTLLGTLPKVFVYGYLGEQLDEFFSWTTILVLGFMMLLALAPYFGEWKRRIFSE